MTKRMHPMLGEVDDEQGEEEPKDVIERKTIARELSGMIEKAVTAEDPRAFGHYCEVCGQYDRHRVGCPTQTRVIDEQGRLRPKEMNIMPKRRPRIRRLLGELLRAVADRLEGTHD